MTQLFLEDLKSMTDRELREHIKGSFEAPESVINEYDILLAYESVGNWGCDSSAYFLLQRKEDGQLFEVRGSHCSCYGFEGQFDPEPTSLEYLASDKFYVGLGGYDSDDEGNTAQINEFVRKLLEGEV